MNQSTSNLKSGRQWKVEELSHSGCCGMETGLGVCKDAGFRYRWCPVCPGRTWKSRREQDTFSIDAALLLQLALIYFFIFTVL